MPMEANLSGEKSTSTSDSGKGFWEASAFG